jgi:hypothetical protein
MHIRKPCGSTAGPDEGFGAIPASPEEPESAIGTTIPTRRPLIHSEKNAHHKIPKGKDDMLSFHESSLS